MGFPCVSIKLWWDICQLWSRMKVSRILNSALCMHWVRNVSFLLPNGTSRSRPFFYSFWMMLFGFPAFGFPFHITAQNLTKKEIRGRMDPMKPIWQCLTLISWGWSCWVSTRHLAHLPVWDSTQWQLNSVTTRPSKNYCVAWPGWPYWIHPSSNFMRQFLFLSLVLCCDMKQNEMQLLNFYSA